MFQIPRIEVDRLTIESIGNNLIQLINEEISNNEYRNICYYLYINADFKGFLYSKLALDEFHRLMIIYALKINLIEPEGINGYWFEISESGSKSRISFIRDLLTWSKDFKYL